MFLILQLIQPTKMSSDSRKMQVMSRVLDLLKQLTQNLESDSQKIVSDLNDLAVKHIDIACDIAMVIERYFETVRISLLQKKLFTKR